MKRPVLDGMGLGPRLVAVGWLFSPLAWGGAARPPAEVVNSATVLSTVGGLAAVLAVVLGLAWVARRYLAVPGLGKGRIQLVGGVSLGPRERAVIVEVDGERLLLGVAQGNVRLLHRLSADGGEFADALARAGQTEDAA
jgi:flagellar protein FliO/FliZ